ITVKHTFDMLKGHFPSLKDLLPEQDIQHTYHLIEALFMLHNLCIDLSDQPKRIPFFSSVDAESDNDEEHIQNDVEVSGYDGVKEQEIELPAWQTDEWLHLAGHQCRLQILDDLFSL
ncbi:hypothetical protein F5I97DRAFT_1817831, partial [Phlebopus sp. FC_14]